MCSCRFFVDAAGFAASAAVRNVPQAAGDDEGADDDGDDDDDGLAAPVLLVVVVMRVNPALGTVNRAIEEREEVLPPQAEAVGELLLLLLFC